jgi:hypothetical protein
VHVRSEEQQAWACVLDFLSPVALASGCWSASREQHAHAVASLRARFGAGGSNAALVVSSPGLPAPLLQLLLGPRVGLRPAALAVEHGSADDARSQPCDEPDGRRSNGQSRGGSSAEQKQWALERVLNQLGQAGALTQLRALDASGGGAAVGIAWAVRFAKHLKALKAQAAVDRHKAAFERLFGGNMAADAGHTAGPSPGAITAAAAATGTAAFAAAAGAAALPEGVTRLPAAIVGEWCMVQHLGFEAGETHRCVRP